MSYKLALSGNQKSGKSAFSRWLRDNQGFTILDHTGAIKESLSLALANTLQENYQYHRNLLEEIKTKESYRTLLIEWARVTGCNEGRVLEPLLKEYAYSLENLVVDNIRYPAQADMARKSGYQIIRIEGGKYFDIESERAMDEYEFDKVLDASQYEFPWYESLLWEMLNLKEDKRLYFQGGFGNTFADIRVEDKLTFVMYSNIYEGMF